MRASLHKLLTDLLPGIDVFEASAMEETPPANKRFVMYRMGGRQPGAGGVGGSRQSVVEIWVHDAPGSYEWIENVLRAVDSRLEEIEHYTVSEGDSIAAATFESNSTDLYDDGFRTITKYTRHRLVGKGI